MADNEKLQQQIHNLEIQKKKWEGSKWRLWFLLPTGANGLLSIMLTLDDFNICSLGTGGWIGLALSTFFIALGLGFWSFSLIIVQRTNNEINRALRKFGQGQENPEPKPPFI